VLVGEQVDDRATFESQGWLTCGPDAKALVDLLAQRRKEHKQ
jgi:hypothetical protein